METKKALILDYETCFASQLASRILEKPKLNAWMIFIPFIFIFYFQDFSNYKKQRKAFLENWLLSRKKILNETADALDENRKPDIEHLSEAADLPEKGKKVYTRLLTVLADHYTGLLRAEGETYPALARSAYSGERGQYIYFLNQLGDVEKALNKSLAPQLKKKDPEVSHTISKIEAHTDRMRRQESKNFFQ